MKETQTVGQSWWSANGRMSSSLARGSVFSLAVFNSFVSFQGRVLGKDYFDLRNRNLYDLPVFTIFYRRMTSL